MGNFIGFYDKDGEPLHEGDRLIGVVTHTDNAWSANKKEIKVTHTYKIVASKYEPRYVLEDEGPVEEVRVPASFRGINRPSFEAYPKNMFSISEIDGRMLNDWHYERIAHLPEEKRYLAMPDFKKIID